MTFTIEAFSWGKDLMIPDIKKFSVADLDEAKKEKNRQWTNPKCFHVRVLSPTDPVSGSDYNLYCMKSRPTNDRELHRSFVAITALEDVETILGDENVNVLRVNDFPQEIPVRLLHLPADKFYCDDGGTDMHEIEPRGASTRSNTFHLNKFETCIAAAAFIPSGCDALLGSSANSWYFLSEVDIKARKAQLSFSMIVNGMDFIR